MERFPRSSRFEGTERWGIIRGTSGVLTVRVGNFGNYIGSRRGPEKGPRVSVGVGVGIGAGAGIGWVQVTPLDSSELLFSMHAPTLLILTHQ